MTEQQPHTPTTEEVRLNYAYLGGAVGEREFDRRTENFDRWYAAEFGRIIAAAEQRGAVKAFKESANEVRRELRWQYEQNINRNSDTGDSIDRLLELEKVFKYRADQMEGDDE